MVCVGDTAGICTREKGDFGGKMSFGVISVEKEGNGLSIKF